MHDDDGHRRESGAVARRDAASLPVQDRHRARRRRTPAFEAPESISQGDEQAAAGRNTRAPRARSVLRARQASDVRRVSRTLDCLAHRPRAAGDPEAGAGSVRARVVQDCRRPVPGMGRVGRELRHRARPGPLRNGRVGREPADARYRRPRAPHGHVSRGSPARTAGKPALPGSDLPRRVSPPASVGRGPSGSR